MMYSMDLMFIILANYQIQYSIVSEQLLFNLLGKIKFTTLVSDVVCTVSFTVNAEVAKVIT